MGYYGSVFINIHQTAESQTLHTLIKRTDSVAQTLRKHGDHPVCQINAGSSFQGFSVNCASALNIIAYICNVHTQMIKIPLLCKRNCIIQILCILAVNGNCHKSGKVISSVPVRFQNMIRHSHCLIHYTDRKFRRDAIAFYNSQNIRSRSMDISQGFCDLSLRLTLLRAIIKDLGNYLFSISDSMRIFRRNINVPGYFLVITEHKAIISFSLKSSHNLCGTSFQNFYNRSLSALSGLLFFFQENLYLILMKRCIYSICRNKNILFILSCFHKSKAPGISDKNALCQKALFFQTLYIFFLK